MRKASVYILFFAALLPALSISAQDKIAEISAAYGATRFVQSFADPGYVGETDYVDSSGEQVRAMARLTGFYVPGLVVAYQGLSVASHSENRFGNTYKINGYYSSFLHLSAFTDSGFVRWHVGFSALATFARRTSADEAGATSTSTAVDTRLSQAYPSGGVTLFAGAPIRFSMIFLNGDANLLYGWLRLQAEFETDSHIFAPAFEMLNHASFGKGLPNFVQPPGAFAFGYTYKVEDLRFGGRLGFVLNSTQGFDNARVTFADRLLFEFSVAWRLKINE